MLRYVLFDFGGLFDDEQDRGISEEGLLWLLESLCQWNQRYLKAHPETPRLYESGVVYKTPEQMSGEGFAAGEHFRDVAAIIENGGGDCDNVAAWRAAELRNAGYKGVRPYITSRERDDGGRTYHALVYWPWPSPKGSTEDPSLILGMGGEARAAERQEELRKNLERAETRAKAIVLGASRGQIPEHVARKLVTPRRRVR